MSAFMRCLSAEILKTRRTIYLLGVIALPTILTLFNFLLLLGIERDSGYYAKPNGWLSYEHNTITFWAILVLPFLIVLVCAFVAHQEHDTHQWRRLMCLAVPRAPIYLAKLALVMGLCLLSSAILWGENLLFGSLLAILRPELGLPIQAIAPWDMLLPYLAIFSYALLIMAIHFWFSLRANNFVLSIGLGLALILAGFFLNEVDVVRAIFPWSLPALVYKAGSLQAGEVGLAYSLIGCVAVSAAGCLDFARHDVLA
jgi:hypothetical protein